MDIVTLALAKKYTDEHGAKGILVGLVDPSTTSFPTTRSDGTPLQNEDFVRPNGSLDPDVFPFTINGITFNSRKDKAYYLSGEWYMDSGVIQETNETPLSNPSEESFETTRSNQYEVNKDVVEQLKNMIIESADLDSIPSDKIYKRIYNQILDTSARVSGLYWYDFNSSDTDKWKKVSKDISYGTLLPSGKYIGQLFILLENVEETSKTVKSGLYYYNGNLWELIATAYKTVKIDSSTGTLSVDDYNTLRVREDNIIIDDEGMVYRYAQELDELILYYGLEKFIAISKSDRTFSINELSIIFTVPKQTITVNSDSYDVPDLEDDYNEIAEAVSQNKKVLIYCDNSYYIVNNLLDTEGSMTISYKDIGILTYNSDGTVILTRWEEKSLYIEIDEETGTLSDDDYSLLISSNRNYILFGNDKLVYQTQDTTSIYYGNEYYFMTVSKSNKLYSVVNRVYDVGSNQYSHDTYVLPAISADDLKKIYTAKVNGERILLRWTFLGSETYLEVLSADYIVNKYSIDVLIHNKYHCYYTWEESTTGLVNPEVSEDKVYDFLSLKRMSEYLYEVTFENIPDYKESNDFIPAGCSSFVKDGMLYRSYDWKYENTAEFKVITKNFDGISMILGMNDGSLDLDKIGQAPYHIVDGCNRNGIRVSAHILYNDFEYEGSGDKNQSIMLLPYYILENVNDISELGTKLANYISNMQIPETLLDSEYLWQFLVTDGTTTYVIIPPETASGEYSIVNATANPKLTNFMWTSEKTVERTSLQNRPTGVERWNEIDNLTDGLRELRFTKAYESTARLSEFIGIDGTTKDSTDAELTDIYNIAHTKYLTRTRNGELWQSVHAVVYDSNGMKHLWVQEDYEKDYAGAGVSSWDIITDDATKIPSAKAIYQYIASGNAGNPRHISNVDLNTITATGFYSCDVCTNRPNNSNGVMLVIKNGGTSDNVVQIYWTFQNDIMYVRHKDLGTWKDWIKTNNLDTTLLAVKNATTESFSGTATNQAEVNEELVAQIKFIESKPDVSDIVQCYDRGTDETKTDIAHYDLSTLLVNDIVKVLIDETHDDKVSYYKVVESGSTKSFSYIGSDKPIETDNITIDKNADGELEVKDEAITFEKLNNGAVATSIDDTPSDKKVPTEKAVKDMDVEVVSISGSSGSLTQEQADKVAKGKIIFKSGSKYYYIHDMSGANEYYFRWQNMYGTNAEYVRVNTSAKTWGITSGAGYENVSNKSTSISSSSTHDQYPSAKSVYDYVDVKVLELTGTSGTLTTDELALINSKEVLIKNSSKIYERYLENSTTVSFITFNVDGSYGSIMVNKSNRQWQYTAQDVFELKSNKKTSISSSSTDKDYPSSKAVFTALKKKVNNIVDKTFTNREALLNSLTNDDTGVNEFLTNFSTASENPTGTSSSRKFFIKVMRSDSATCRMYAFSYSDNKVWTCYRESSGFTAWEEVGANSKEIELTGDSGTLTSAQLNLITSNPQNVIINVTSSGESMKLYLSYQTNTNILYSNIMQNNNIDVVVTKSSGAWTRLIKTFEETANKTTEINGASTDNQYPSAKAVYDNAVLEEISVSSSSGTLTSAQLAKINANPNRIIFVYSGHRFRYATLTSADKYMFRTSNGEYELVFSVDKTTGVYSYGNTKMENTANKKTSWSTTPTDTNYPSEKLTKNSLDSKQNIETRNGVYFEINAGTWSRDISTATTAVCDIPKQYQHDTYDLATFTFKAKGKYTGSDEEGLKNAYGELISEVLLDNSSSNPYILIRQEFRSETSNVIYRRSSIRKSIALTRAESYKISTNWYPNLSWEKWQREIQKVDELGDNLTDAEKNKYPSVYAVKNNIFFYNGKSSVTRQDLFNATKQRSTTSYECWFASSDAPDGNTNWCIATVSRSTSSGSLKVTFYSTGDTYVCANSNGTWTPWKKVVRGKETTWLHLSSNSAITYCRKGNIVFLNFNYAKLTTGAKSIVLPEGYRPNDYVGGTLCSAAKEVALIWGDADGFQMYGGDTSKYYYGTISFPTDD